MDGNNRFTLARYVARRNGVPLGAKGSLSAMFRRSLGAGSLAVFWHHWNPIFGYYLGRYVHAPLNRVIPRGAAIVITFAVSGAIHDVATTLVRGSITLLFTLWFTALGAGVVLATATGMDYSERRWGERAAINLAYVTTGLLAAIAGNRLLGLA